MTTCARNGLPRRLTRNKIASTMQFGFCMRFAQRSRRALTAWRSSSHSSLAGPGGDLDLYSNATPASVIKLMTERFHAKLEARSWGDRLANKWNFKLPGLAESVEVHVGRLGQTGEQETIASSLLQRTRQVSVAGQISRCVNLRSHHDLHSATDVSAFLFPAV